MIIGILLVSAGIGQTFKEKSNQKKYISTTKSVISTPLPLPTFAKTITIDISGSLQKPGLYSLPSGSRVQDALIAAGGLSAKADRIWVSQNINLAKILSDEEKVYVPAVGSHPERLQGVEGSSTAKIAIAKKPSLNNASLEELIAVNGIGPATARLIINWRQENGGFKILEDLGKIPGIGPKSLAKILPQVSL